MNDDKNKESETNLEESSLSVIKAGAEVIASFQKRLPNSPGVYRMYDAAESLLYVGKAVSLKKRVASYTRMTGHTNRIMRMIAATVNMEFITTKTETEALLLEANLVKKLKPRYNILLRDDKSFAHILITGDHEAPCLLKHRGARNRKGEYFGPFASAGDVNQTINTLQRAFLLRTCTDSVYASRSRPCLQYQIKRCSAPCTKEINLEAYNRLVTESRDFLTGKSNAVRAHLQALMAKASEAMDYETAVIYRDRLAALTQIQSHQGINPQQTEQADVFAIYREGSQVCIQVFFFRNFQNWGNHGYYPRSDKSDETEEILASFIAQFYDNKPSPHLILVSVALKEESLLQDALTLKSGKKVEILTPQRGEKVKLVEHAYSNAKSALLRRLSESASQKRLLEGVQEIFGMDQMPLRIEAYDNSHIQGTNAVGGMIVAGLEGFAKSHYRKFTIKSTDLTPGDDFAMMKEVLTRRLSGMLKVEQENKELAEQQRKELALLEEKKHQEGRVTAPEEEQETVEADSHESAMPIRPDLLLIDGGAGQLSVVMEVIHALGITGITVVGIAKGPERNAGRERFFMPGRKAFSLPPDDKVLFFVQRLRDEVHRFAIGTHRAKRKKAMIKNPLDEVSGIGAKRKKALLLHFGSAKAVSRAAVEDLRAVEGISKQMAQNIYDHFYDSA